MMHLAVEQIGKGLHPTETVVAVKAEGRTERLVVPTQSIVNGAIEIGWPLREKGNLFLVELPRETQSGAWRVWVRKDQVSPKEERMTA